jgi:phosphate transport system permease protein
MDSLRTWFQSGLPWVWLNAAAVSTSILLVTGLLLLIAGRGMVHFWPAAVHEIVYLEADGSRSRLSAHIRDRERIEASRLEESGVPVEEGVEEVERILLKIGNRDLGGQDFRWILEPGIIQQTQPFSLVVLEREEWGRFFGRVIGLMQDGELVASSDVWADFRVRLERAADLREKIRDLEKGAIGRVNYRMERLRLEERERQLEGALDEAARVSIEQRRQALDAEYRRSEEELLALNEAIRRDVVLMETSGGQQVELPLHTIIDAWKPNALRPQSMVFRQRRAP